MVQMSVRSIQVLVTTGVRGVGSKDRSVRKEMEPRKLRNLNSSIGPESWEPAPAVVLRTVGSL